MNIHTRKRAMFMRSVARRNAVSAQEPKKFALSSQRKAQITRRNDSFGADTEGFALSSQRKAQITRRNAVSAQEPKSFALSSQRKLSVLLVVGILILSAKECEMKPVGPGGDGTPDPMVNKPDPGPVVNDPLAPTGPLSLARTVVLDPEVTLASDSNFGRGSAFVGDLDGGGGTVLAVGDFVDDTGGSRRGAIYLLSYDDEGALQSTKKIAHGVDETNGTTTTLNTLAPSLSNTDRFGTSLANAGDLYGDGNTVLAVGAEGSDTGKGAVYLLSFSTSGNLTATTKIASGTAKGPSLTASDFFGVSLANAGDLYGNEGTVLAVGANGDDTGGADKGAIYLLSFSTSGNLTATTKIASGTANGPTIVAYDQFGYSLANAGDLYNNGGTVLVTGAREADGFKGAIYLLSFNAAGSLTGSKKIGHGVDETNGTADTQNTLAPSIAGGEVFGASLANAGDLDGGGGTVLAVGESGSGAGVNRLGSIHLLSFNSAGSLAGRIEIANGTTNGPVYGDGYYFGTSLANAGNLDGSGGRVLLVGGLGELQLLYYTAEE